MCRHLQEEETGNETAVCVQEVYLGGDSCIMRGETSSNSLTVSAIATNFLATIMAVKIRR